MKKRTKEIIFGCIFILIGVLLLSFIIWAILYMTIGFYQTLDFKITKTECLNQSVGTITQGRWTFRIYSETEVCEELELDKIDIGGCSGCGACGGATIKKSDLTIDWLEKYAICHKCSVETTTRGYYTSRDYMYCEDELAGWYDKCHKYKYMDYTIEVLE